MTQQYSTHSEDAIQKTKPSVLGKNKSSEYNVYNGLILCDHYFPTEILVSILCSVDSKSLRKNCVLVCKKWRDLISQSVWKVKAERQVNQSLPVLSPNMYFLISLNENFDKNLISNPSGENNFKGWTIFNCNKNAWIVEDCSEGCEPLPEKEFGKNKKCFATLYNNCTKMLEVDLFKYFPYELTKLQPHIYICEWYGTRFNSASEYNLNVTLSDCGKCICKEFDFRFSEEKFQGGKWNKIEHTFKNYGQFGRYITFYHSGKGYSDKGGHSGLKLFGATVKVLSNTLGQDLDKDDENDYCLLQKKGNDAIEPRRRSSYERLNPPNWFLKSEDECSD